MESLEAITDRIYLVKGENEGRFPYSHSILIVDKEIVLIDTGCGIKTLRQIKRKFDVSYVINSHTHPDHSAGNWVFSNRPIYVPTEGFDTSGDIIALSERFVGKRFAKIWREFVKGKMGFKNCKPTDSYNEQTVFNFGKTTLKPIYTPGHTKDHYCFYEEEKRILFSFDYDLTSFPWYGHRESSLLKFIDSVKKLKSLKPKIVVTSHRGIIAEDINTEFDKFLKIIRERNEKILTLLENGKTVNQVLEHVPIYGKFFYAEQLLRYWERQMIKKHLKILQTAGRVKKCGGTYFKV
jgi:glyoxylase-like metal-dependent hydrolase (beta-lactamase superfamily II)